MATETKSDDRVILRVMFITEKKEIVKIPEFRKVSGRFAEY